MCSSTPRLIVIKMDSSSLHHLADVALSRGASSVVPDASERITSPRLRSCPLMPHIDTYFQLAVESPQPHNRAPAPTFQIQSHPASADTRHQSTLEQTFADFIEQISAVLSRFELGIHQLAQQQTSQSSHQSPPTTLALSECELRRNPYPIPQTSQDSGFDAVRFTLPATGQRTGANPNPSPLATTTSTPPLPPRKPEWDHENRDLQLKSANRPHYSESSGIRIRAFVEDAKNFLEMCGRSRARWARFIISWVGPNVAEKMRRSYFVADGVDYNAFREGLFIFFGRLDVQVSYRQQLRELVQSDPESVAEFASRTTDLSTRA